MCGKPAKEGEEDITLIMVKKLCGFCNRYYEICNKVNGHGEYIRQKKRRVANKILVIQPDSVVLKERRIKNSWFTKRSRVKRREFYKCFY